MKTQFPEEYNSLFFIIGAIPFLCFFILNLFYFHSAIIVGHLPTYDNPDPKELPIYEFYSFIIFILMNLSLYIFLPWLVFTIYHCIRFRKYLSKNWKAIVFPIVTYSLLILEFFSEKIGWFMD
jgi:hypothetical protein